MAFGEPGLNGGIRGGFGGAEGFKGAEASTRDPVKILNLKTRPRLQKVATGPQKYDVVPLPLWSGLCRAAEKCISRDTGEPSQH